ncbi:MAG: nitrogenase component 1 [Oscillospiraceae bacterium]|nr:nitrogenase component 1 [Oscillospiraceae bacterium]
MSLYRFLPAPSHRMAVMWTLMSVKDAIVLEYGPAGTTHYSMGLFGSMGLSNENRLFTTHISEDDVVMGDVSRLENAIVELDASFKPKVIFVMESGVTSVIGTDIHGVCKHIQEKVSAHVISVGEGGLRGDYATGLCEAYKTIVSQLPVDGAQQQQTINILGASAGSYRITSDVWELKDLFNRAFGLRVGVCLGLETPVKEIQQMSGASLNVALRTEAIPCAEILKDRFGTPFVYGSPYGYSGTLSWLKEIGVALGVDINEIVEETLAQKDQESRQNLMPGMMGGIRQFNATIVGDYDLLRGISAFLKEAGITHVNMICSHGLKDVTHKAEGITYFETEKERLMFLKSINNHLLLADDVSMHVAPKDNMGVCVSFPFSKHPQVATHLPIMGERGADMLLELVERFMARPVTSTNK